MRAAVAARREDADAGRTVQQRGRQLRAGGQQMLAVVEDQEQSAVAQLLDQRVQGRLFGVVVQAERVGRGERDERRVVQAGEVREAHAVRERPLDPGGDPPGQPRLADAAGSGQRDQSCGGQQPPPFGQFVPPVDEAGRLDRWLMDPSRRRSAHDQPVLWGVRREPEWVAPLVLVLSFPAAPRLRTRASHPWVHFGWVRDVWGVGAYTAGPHICIAPGLCALWRPACAGAPLGSPGT